jgi:flagellar biosynthesis GTPase FlhF
MESTAFFEKKISLTPTDFNKVKTRSIDDILVEKARELMENKCSEQGFVIPGSVKLLSRSMGYFEAARFTGDAIYYVKLQGKIVYPADGVRVSGEVIRKNKMGLYVDYHKAIRIQIPRDLHIGNIEYDSVEIGDIVDVELKRSKFQINDPYILATGLFVEKLDGNTTGRDTAVATEVEQAEEEQKEDNEQEQEAEEESEEEQEEQEQEEEEEEEQEEEDEEEQEEEDEQEEEEQE